MFMETMESMPTDDGCVLAENDPLDTGKTVYCPNCLVVYNNPSSETLTEALTCRECEKSVRNVQQEVEKSGLKFVLRMHCSIRRHLPPPLPPHYFTQMLLASFKTSMALPLFICLIKFSWKLSNYKRKLFLEDTLRLENMSNNNNNRAIVSICQPQMYQTSFISSLGYQQQQQQQHLFLLSPIHCSNHNFINRNLSSNSFFTISCNISLNRFSLCCL